MVKPLLTSVTVVIESVNVGESKIFNIVKEKVRFWVLEAFFEPVIAKPGR